jgi:hypothetical protein
VQYIIPASLTVNATLLQKSQFQLSRAILIIFAYKFFTITAELCAMTCAKIMPFLDSMIFLVMLASLTFISHLHTTESYSFSKAFLGLPIPPKSFFPSAYKKYYTYYPPYS